MTSETIINLITWFCFIGGGFFLFVGSLGMIKLEDFWARLHAASIVDSAGAGLILLGFMLQTGLTLVTVKIVIIIMFLFLTGPTASHAVANAAFVSGYRPKNLIEDETDTPPTINSPSAKTKTKEKTKMRSRGKQT